MAPTQLKCQAPSSHCSHSGRRADGKRTAMIGDLMADEPVPAASTRDIPDGRVRIGGLCLVGNSFLGMVLPSMVSPVGVYLMRTFIVASVPPDLGRLRLWLQDETAVRATTSWTSSAGPRRETQGRDEEATSRSEYSF